MWDEDRLHMLNVGLYHLYFTFQWFLKIGRYEMSPADELCCSATALILISLHTQTEFNMSRESSYSFDEE